MKTISENLQKLKNSTDDIRQAILNKGGNITGDISTWADAITNIVSSEGGSGLGHFIKTDIVSNKLNGATLTFSDWYTTETEIYKYNIVKEYQNSLVVNIGRMVGGLNAFNLKGIGSCFLTPPNDLNDDIVSGGMGGMSGAPLVTCYTDGTISILHDSSITNFSFRTITPVTLIFFSEDKYYDIDYFYLDCSWYCCFLKDTDISLSTGITKKVQDITYNDELLVWNFDDGEFNKAKPLWIKKKEIALSYYKVTLENGIILNLVGSNGKCHRLFNYDDQLFESATDLVGKQVSTLQGLSKVVSVEIVEETCEYYNIITEYHMNCYANGVLTSCRYNNLYPIVDMKYDKSQVKLEPRYKIHAEKFKPNPKILPKYIRGMRLDENTTISIEDMKSYISNLERVRKNIDDFEENQEMVESVEEASVGWIDPEGNVYGYKLYMPGQMNHITLANKICKKLGYKEQELGGYSKTLEDLGWCKFTDEFLLAVSDLTDRQEHKLAKFMSTNPKVKKRGTIKLGNIFSEPTNIENVKKMSKKDLTNKMRGHGNKKN